MLTKEKEVAGAISGDNKRQQKILVIRLSAMGDVAMVVPVVEALVAQNSNVQVTVLTVSFLAPLFKHIPNVEIFTAQIKDRHNTLLGVWRLFCDLRSFRRFDAVIDLHDIIRTKMLRRLFRLFGTNVYTIDKGRAQKKNLVLGVGEKRQLTTSIERYADVLRLAGFSIELKPIVNSCATIPALIAEKFTPGKGRWIGVAPFAQHLGKRYPMHLLMDAISQIEKSNPGITIFIFGGGAKEAATARWYEQCFPSCFSVIGKLSLVEEMSLISNLDCMVAMDSSAMHMASNVGVRVVSVWGATHPFAGFLGFGQSEDDVVSVDLDCRPCSIYGNKPCAKDSYECMLSIDPAQIVSRVNSKS